MYSDIRYEVDDPIATITLDRPEQLNAWTPTMDRELRDAVGRAERDRAVVAIVITGAGRGWCAGADMETLQGLTDGDEGGGAPTASGAPGSGTPGDPSWGEDLRGTYTYLMSVPKPVIAAVNGAVAGMAVPIALSCDLRFAAEDAVITTAFAQRGLVAEWGISWLLPRLVGSANALDLLFSARRVTGSEAAAMGLVNRAVPGDQLLPTVRAYVEDLAASCSPTSMAVMKRQVYQQLHAGLAGAERDTQALMAESFERPDFREGVSSFVEKRPPQFPRIGDQT